MNEETLRQVLNTDPNAWRNPAITIPATASGMRSEQVRTLTSFASAAEAKGYLESLDLAGQMNAFGELSVEEQAQLRALGYKSAETQVDDGKRSWLGKLAGGVNSVVMGIADKPADLGSFIWGHLDTAKNQVVQTQRANRYGHEQGDGFFNTLKAIAIVPNALQYWDEVEDGERVYVEDELNEVKNSTDPFVFQVAKWESEGDSQKIIELRDMFNAANDQAAVEKLYVTIESPEYKDTLKRLSGAKLSLGRDLARSMDLDPTGSAFKYVSGTGDAIQTLASDPITYIPIPGISSRYALNPNKGHLKDTAALRARLDVIYGPAQFDEAGEALPAVGRQIKAREAADEIGQALEKIRAAGAIKGMDPADAIRIGEDATRAKDMLNNKYRHFFRNNSTLDALIDSPVTDWRTFREFVESSSGMVHVLGGQTAHRAKVLPYRRSVKEYVSKHLPFDKPARWYEEGGKHAAMVRDSLGPLYASGGIFHGIDVRDQEPVLEAIRAAAGQGSFRGKTTTLSRRIKTRLPSVDENGRMLVSGAGSTENFTNFAKMILPNFMADRVSTVYAASDVAQRKEIIMGVYASAIEAYGLRTSAAGSAMADNMMSSVKRANGSSAYTNAGLRRGITDEPALLRAHMTEHVELPDFREFMRVMGQHAFSNQFIRGANHRLFETAVLGLWRSVILLRPALAFRNSNEETANNFLRNGGLDIGKQVASKWYTQQASREAREDAILVARNQVDSEVATLERTQLAYDRDIMFPFGGTNKSFDMPRMAREDIKDNLDNVLHNRRLNLNYAREQLDAGYAARKQVVTDLRKMAESKRKEAAKLERDLAKGMTPEQQIAKGKTPSVASLDPMAARAQIQSLRDEANEMTASAFRAQKDADEAYAKSASYQNSMRDDFVRIEDSMAGRNTKLEEAWSMPKAFDRDSGRVVRAITSVASGTIRLLEGANPTAAYHLDSKNWADWIDAAIGKKLAGASEAFLKRIDPDSIKYLRDLANDPMGSNMLMDEIIGVARKSVRMDVGDATGKGNKWTRLPSGKLVEMKFIPSQAERLNTGADDGLMAWSNQLEEFMDDAIGNIALRYADDPVRAEAAVLNAMNLDTEFQRLSKRYKESPEDTAKAFVAEARALTSNMSGEFDPRVWRMFVQNRQTNRAALDPDNMKALPNELRPPEVLNRGGGVWFPVDGNHLKMATENMWDVLGTMTATLSRHHQFPWEYVQARKRLGAWQETRSQQILADAARSKITKLPPGKSWDEMTPAEQAAFQKKWIALQGEMKAGYAPEGGVVPGADSPMAKLLNMDAADISRLRKAIDRKQRANRLGTIIPQSMKQELDELKQYSFSPAYEDVRNRSITDIIDARKMEFVKQPMTKEIADQIAANEATRHALEHGLQAVLKYVDNPAVRSQAAVMIRTLGPFYRAQEEFARRWTNVVVHSPKSIWRAHVALEAGDDSGFIYEDAYGRRAFVYPGSGAVSGVILNISAKLGIDSIQYIAPKNFGGTVMGLAPGFDINQNLHPVSGPLISVPLAIVETATGSQAVRDAQSVILGSYAVDGKPWESLVPTYIREMEPFGADPEQTARDTIASIASLAAAGIDLPDNATPTEKQVYLDLVAAHVRGRKWSRVGGSFLLPAVPKMNIDNQATALGSLEDAPNIDAEFAELVEKFGYDRAYHLYQSVFPDKLPFLVGTNDYAAGRTPPVGENNLQYMKDNAQFLAAYPGAGALLLPIDKGEYSGEAWKMAGYLGMFESKEAEQLAMEVAYAADKQEYFRMRNMRDEQLDAAREAGDTQKVRNIEAGWTQWSENYRARNPLVAEYIDGGGERAVEREQRLVEVRKMLNDPRLPVSVQSEDAMFVLQQWDNLDFVRSQYPSQSASDVLRRKLAREAFDTWMEQKALDNPTVDIMWSTIFKYIQ